MPLTAVRRCRGIPGYAFFLLIVRRTLELRDTLHHRGTHGRNNSSFALHVRVSSTCQTLRVYQPTHHRLKGTQPRDVAQPMNQDRRIRRGTPEPRAGHPLRQEAQDGKLLDEILARLEQVAERGNPVLCHLHILVVLLRDLDPIRDAHDRCSEHAGGGVRGPTPERNIAQKNKTYCRICSEKSSGALRRRCKKWLTWVRWIGRSSTTAWGLKNWWKARLWRLHQGPYDITVRTQSKPPLQVA